MHAQIDILENEILEKYPDVLDVLLRDHTTQRNILWATNNYKDLGQSYNYKSEISPESITGRNGNVIMLRVQKDKVLQQSRARNMAEVFTPSWICNAQNNLIDNSWFERENVFNKEIELDNGSWTWDVNTKKITFPKNKTWKDYVRDKRLEMACGEAPIYTIHDSITTTEEYVDAVEQIMKEELSKAIGHPPKIAKEEWCKSNMEKHLEKLKQKTFATAS